MHHSGGSQNAAAPHTAFTHGASEAHGCTVAGSIRASVHCQVRSVLLSRQFNARAKWSGLPRHSSWAPGAGGARLPDQIWLSHQFGGQFSAGFCRVLGRPASGAHLQQQPHTMMLGSSVAVGTPVALRVHRSRAQPSLAPSRAARPIPGAASPSPAPSPSSTALHAARRRARGKVVVDDDDDTGDVEGVAPEEQAKVGSWVLVVV